MKLSLPLPKNPVKVVVVNEKQSKKNDMLLTVEVLKKMRWLAWQISVKRSKI